VHCTFIETPLFSETADFLSDDELRVAQIAIVANPRAGAAIRETHGARKLRVRMRGRGKSGAARIIYLDNSERCGLADTVKDSPCLANPATQRSQPRLTT